VELFKMRSLFLFFLVSCCCYPALAETQVAFLEVTTYLGKPVLLEDGGRFAHVAISFRGEWLHSHPIRGVEVTSLKNLQKIGKITRIVTLPERSPPDDATVRKMLGRAYDQEYSWTDQRYYCSELVAKLLEIPAEPMVFSPKYWPPQFQRLNGSPGVSPDGLYRALGAGVRN
jgi:hypothetical protein